VINEKSWERLGIPEEMEQWRSIGSTEINSAFNALHNIVLLVINL
jgi:hypothetical protein